jgi:hypothetical protein
MDYEFVLKLVALVLGGGSFFIALRHMVVAYINKNKEKKLIFKRDNREVITQGELTPAEAVLISEFFKTPPAKTNSTKKLLKPKKD